MLVASKFTQKEIAKIDDFDFMNQCEISNLEQLIDFLCIASGEDPIFSGLSVIQNTPASMYVQLNIGAGYCYSTKNIFQNLSLISNIAIQNGGASDRIDTLQVRQKKNDYDQLSRAFKDPWTGAITYQNVNTKTKVEIEVSVLMGTEGAGVAPNHTVGWTKIAEIHVSAGQSTQIVTADIKNITASLLIADTTLWTAEKTSSRLFGKIFDNDKYMEGEIAKMGGASLDTDILLGSGSPSDAKVASQKATKTYVDARVSVEYETLLSSDTTLLPNTKYKTVGSLSLSLPATPSEGQRVEVFAEDSCRIIQGDANHSVAYLDRFFTTKGITGYLQLLSKSKLLMTYKGSGLSRIEPGLKISNPGNLPVNSGNGCDFSPDGIYCAVAHTDSPYITIYKRSGDTFNKLSNPGNLPAGSAYSCAFSFDGIYLAVGHATTPFITIYKRSGDTFTKLTDPVLLPTGIGLGCRFSYDTTYLAVTHDTSRYVTIYKRSSDTFTKLTDPGTLPTGIGRGCSFSYDGDYLAVSHSTSPYITIYKRAEDVFTKIADTTLPAGDGYGCSFSPDGNYLAIAHTTTPFITVYEKNGIAFAKLPDPASLPAGNGKSCHISNNGNYLSVGCDTTPFIAVYKRFGDTFSKLSNPATLPAGIGNGCRFSFDGAYLGVAHPTTPFITIYKNLEAVTKQWLVETLGTLYDDDLQYLFK